MSALPPLLIQQLKFLFSNCLFLGKRKFGFDFCCLARPERGVCECKDIFWNQRMMHFWSLLEQKSTYVSRHLHFESNLKMLKKLKKRRKRYFQFKSKLLKIFFKIEILALHSYSIIVSPHCKESIVKKAREQGSNTKGRLLFNASSNQDQITLKLR